MFCREFENVVNRAFLVLIFLGEKLVGANFYAFCNYATQAYLHQEESLVRCTLEEDEFALLSQTGYLATLPLHLYSCI